MSISIKIVQRTDKRNRNHTAPIHLRLTHKGKSRYISTGVTVPLDAWNAEKQLINTDYPSAGELQFKVDSVRIEYQKKIKRLQALEIEVTFDNLLETNGSRMAITVEDSFNREIERLESLGVFSSAGKHKFALSVLNAYKSAKIPLETVDTDYLKGFELFLRERGNKDNSIATRFAIFKAIYNKAVKEGRIRPKQNPFVTYKIGSLWAKTRKRSITKEDIRKIAELEIPYNYRSDYKQFARDIFLFSYYTAGINFKDIATLRHSDIVNGRICYSRHKTGKVISCQLLPDAQQIIEKHASPFYDDNDYIFPILDRRVHRTEQQIFNRIHKVLARVNSNLKVISKELGLPFPLTTYVARHTYATVLKRSGVNIALISESLGHSDLATTQIYLDSFENSQIDEAMQNLL